MRRTIIKEVQECPAAFFRGISVWPPLCSLPCSSASESPSGPSTEPLCQFDCPASVSENYKFRKIYWTSEKEDYALRLEEYWGVLRKKCWRVKCASWYHVRDTKFHFLLVIFSCLSSWALMPGKLTSICHNAWTSFSLYAHNKIGKNQK